MKPIIHIDSLCKRFQLASGLFNRNPRYVNAVDRVSLDIHEGEIIGLIGESGSGKTTLARVLLGLTPATSGVAEVNGRNIVGAKRGELRKVREEISVVFQDPAANLNPRQTVESSITRPLVIRGMKRRAARKLAEEALEKVKLDASYLQSYPHQLSGGQQQRIAIARAMVLDPRIMILDEPTSALDISVQAQVLNLLLDLQEEFHLTYLVITHDINVIRYIADRIAVMYMGRLVELGPADSILEHPIHPYTINLEEYVPVLDPGRRTDKQKSVLTEEKRLSDQPEDACILCGTCPWATEACAKRRPELIEYAPGHFAACNRRVDAYEPVQEEAKEELQ